MEKEKEKEKCPNCGHHEHEGKKCDSCDCTKS